MPLSVIVIQIIAFAFAISIHEMAHAWAADRLGDPTARLEGRLSLNPLVHIDPVMTVLFPAMLILMGSPVVFGAARPVPVDTRNLDDPRRDHCWIAAAGPLSNLLLAGIAIVLLRWSWRPLSVAAAAGGLGASVGEPLLLLLHATLLVNVVLAVFNLIPLHPLDGSWILSRFLSGAAARAYASMQPYGFIILIGLLWVGVFDSILRPVLGLVQLLLNL